MLQALGFLAVDIDGQMGPHTSDAVRRFQSQNGLAAAGSPGPNTRKKLFFTYMDKICGKDFKLDKGDDFLARGNDRGGKGDFQDVASFNPVLTFSDPAPSVVINEVTKI